MKFSLVIIICSFLNNQCLTPMNVEIEYNSWKECTIAAYTLSKILIEKQEDAIINDNYFATQFTCAEIDRI